MNLFISALKDSFPKGNLMFPLIDEIYSELVYSFLFGLLFLKMMGFSIPLLIESLFQFEPDAVADFVPRAAWGAQPYF
jgi:hypothetical protein